MRLRMGTRMGVLVLICSDCKPPAEELTSRDVLEICTEENLRLGLLICYVVLYYVMLWYVMT